MNYHLELIFFILLTGLIYTTGWGMVPENVARKPDSSQLPVDLEFRPELGTYFYDIFWKGARVGKAAITIDKDDDLYKIGVHADSNSKVSMLYKFRYKGEVEVEPYPLKPVKAKVTEKAGRKEKKIEFSFPEDDRVEAVEVKSVGGKKRSVTEKRATSTSFIVDPFSVVFLVRHLDWHIGMAEVFDVFTGKKKYQLTLYCKSVVTKTVGDAARQAWEIIPEMIDFTKPEEKKRAEFRIFLSKDEKKEILKIEGAPRIGRVEATIRKFVPKSSTK